jgi:hypothetical protein
VIRPPARSVLDVPLQGENRNGAAVAVVSRVVDELIVERELGEAEYGDSVICFEDLFGAGVGQLAVADNPAETAGGQIELALVRDPIDRAGQPERVIGPAPS